MSCARFVPQDAAASAPESRKIMHAATGLGYSIHSCTSDNPQYPIASIQSASVRSPGWQCSPSPRYPVEFVLDLGAVADLETIQFVAPIQDCLARRSLRRRAGSALSTARFLPVLGQLPHELLDA
jgi:hypothetical protein